MSDSVLNRILSNDTKNQKEQAKQTSLLQEILVTQKELLKSEDQRRRESKRAAQKDKRRSGDRAPSAAIKKGGGDDKKKGKSFLEKIGSAITGLLTGLGGLGLIKALGLAAVGTAIGAYFKSEKFRKKVNEALGFAKDAIGNFLFNSKDGIFNAKKRKELGKAIGDFFTKDAPWKKNFRQGISDFFIKDAPWKENARKGMSDFFIKDAPWKVAIRNGFMDLVKMITKPVTDAMAKLDRGIQDFGTDTVDRLTGNKTGKDTRDTKTALTAAQVKKQNADIRGTPNPEADVDVKILTELKTLQSQRDNMEAQRKKALKTIKENEAKPKDMHTTEVLKRARKTLEEVDTNLAIKYAELKKRAGFIKGSYDIDVRTQAFQQGGFVGTVPNQGGDGDRFGAMLAPGSVVLNQTASGYMQNGGMVPTMLEQGEKVYAPNDPAAGFALMMNSMIPRFQEGGKVPDGTKDSKEVPAAAASDLTGKGAQFTSGPITPGGKMTFIGDGSGFTGEIKLIDGAGKVAAKIGGVSGTSRTAGASQEQRKNVSGTLNPLPDGDFPLETQTTRHPGQTVGQWSSWINNPAGQIGNRGQLYVHNDIGSNGTAGCIGIEAGGARGSKNSMKFADVYDQVAPTSVKVNLASSAGGSYSPDDGGGGGNGGGFFGGVGDMMANALGPLGQVIKEFAELFSGAGLLGDLFGNGSGTNGMSAEVTGVATPLSGDTQAKAKEMYDYIISKGYNDAQAKGLVANIHRESTFNPTARSGDDGGAGGLFQWKGSRQTSQVQSLVNSGNWKGQIDYALSEPGEWSASAYKTDTASMSAQQAADWWMKHWERPADPAAGSQKHANYLASYGFQKGGVANMSGGSSYSTSMVQKSQQQFAEEIAKAVTPVVIPVPSGGGGGGGGRDSGAGPSTSFPVLSAEDSSIVSMEYKYRITMGASI